MKEFRFRIILIVAFVALSLYLLYPTYADFTNTSEINEELVRLSDSIKIAQPTISDADLEDIINFKEDSIRVADPSIREARDKRVKLGLDLQGGMYLVMEVNTAKLLENLVKNADEDFNRMLAEAENEANLSDENLVSILSAKIQDSGKRLSRYFGSIREDDSEIIARLEEQESDAVTRAIEIISNRVNQYGVSEPNIQKQGARRIVVELPGISKEEEAKRLLQGSALLEFKFAREPEFVIPIMNRIDEVLAGKVDTADADTSSLDSDTTDVADLSEEEFARQHPFYSIALMTGNDPFPLVQEINMDKINSYLNRREVRNIIPDNVEFLFSAKPIITQDDINYYRLYMVNKEAELTGGVITDANANIDPQTTAPVVYMTMNSEGAREWARITGAKHWQTMCYCFGRYCFIPHLELIVKFQAVDL
jgi:SecD/SecF fusion protein